MKAKDVAKTFKTVASMLATEATQIESGDPEREVVYYSEESRQGTIDALCDALKAVAATTWDRK